MTSTRLALWAHVQTATAAVPLRRALPSQVRTEVHEIPIPEGGVLVGVCHLLGRRAPAVVVLHGVAGSSDDPYVVRAAHELVRAGFHVLRLNQRGSGRGIGKSRRLYHAALSEDLALAARFLEERPDVTAVGALGFSLGGHVSLTHVSDDAPACVQAVVSVSAPLDLARTIRSFESLRPTPFSIYERLMVRSLVEKARALKRRVPSVPFELDELAKVATIDAFDRVVTCPCNGYADVPDYHARASVGPRLDRVRTPTLIIHAADDPVCPIEPVREAVVSPSVERIILSGGGHVGFIEGVGQLFGASAAVMRARDFLAEHLQR